MTTSELLRHTKIKLGISDAALIAEVSERGVGASKAAELVKQFTDGGMVPVVVGEALMRIVAGMEGRRA